ncbi:MAG: hypothetical protein JNK19_03890 [Tabrizicola sp.]|nr:hypothetical protein [Tabrizicola sp.]
MTLRELGQSITDRWDAYLTEIATEHVLDWSIGHLVLTFVGGAIGFSLIMGLIGAVVAVAFLWLAPVWKKTGLPATMERLDKRFGPHVAGVFAVVGSIAFFSVLLLLIALLEKMAQR